MFLTGNSKGWAEEDEDNVTDEPVLELLALVELDEVVEAPRSLEEREI